MSPLISPNAASLQATPSAKAPGNGANAPQGDASHFDRVLSRSLANPDNPAEKTPIAKSSNRTTARRTPNENFQQDTATTPVLIFMPVQQIKTEANGQLGNSDRLQSTAQNAGGKLTPFPPPTAEMSGKNATPRSHTVSTARPADDGEHATPAHGLEQPIVKTTANAAAGQQTPHSDRHDKPDKLDNQAATEAGPKENTRHVDAAAKTTADNANHTGLDVTAAANQIAVSTADTPNATVPAPVRLPLTPTVGSNTWSTALGKQVVWMANTNNQTAELHLNPPDLGPLKVTLTINDNQAQAMFVSAHQSVRAAVEAALPQLRSNLADNGISLSNTSVSADMQQQQQNTFAQHQSGHNGARHNIARNADATTPGALVERSAAPVSRRNSGSRNVDTFA